MTMQFPEEFRWLGYIIGMEWPEGDEDAMRRVGEAWQTAAGSLEDVAPDLDAAARTVQSGLEGATSESLEKIFAEMLTGAYSMDKLAEAARNAGKMSDSSATQIEYTKISFYAALALLAAQIAWAIASAFWSFGASLSSIPVFQAVARTAVGIGLKNLIEAIGKNVAGKVALAMAKGAAVNFVLGAGQDAAIQLGQMAAGKRDGFDWQQFGKTAATSLAGGAVGGGAGHYLEGFTKSQADAITTKLAGKGADWEKYGGAATSWAKNTIDGAGGGVVQAAASSGVGVALGDPFSAISLIGGAAGGGLGGAAKGWKTQGSSTPPPDGSSTPPSGSGGATDPGSGPHANGTGTSDSTTGGSVAGDGSAGSGGPADASGSPQGTGDSSSTTNGASDSNAPGANDGSTTAGGSDSDSNSTSTPDDFATPANSSAPQSDDGASASASPSGSDTGPVAAPQDTAAPAAEHTGATDASGPNDGGTNTGAASDSTSGPAPAHAHAHAHAPASGAHHADPGSDTSGVGVGHDGSTGSAPSSDAHPDGSSTGPDTGGSDRPAESGATIDHGDQPPPSDSSTPPDSGPTPSETATPTPDADSSPPTHPTSDTSGPPPDSTPEAGPAPSDTATPSHQPDGMGLTPDRAVDPTPVAHHDDSGPPAVVQDTSSTAHDTSNTESAPANSSGHDTPPTAGTPTTGGGAASTGAGHHGGGSDSPRSAGGRTVGDAPAATGRPATDSAPTPRPSTDTARSAPEPAGARPSTPAPRPEPVGAGAAASTRPAGDGAASSRPTPVTHTASNTAVAHTSSGATPVAEHGPAASLIGGYGFVDLPSRPAGGLDGSGPIGARPSRTGGSEPGRPRAGGPLRDRFGGPGDAPPSGDHSDAGGTDHGAGEAGHHDSGSGDSPVSQHLQDTLDIPAYEARSLSNADTRTVYAHGEQQIARVAQELRDQGVPADERAHTLFDLRNELRGTARDLMSDQAAADTLRSNERNFTWDDIVAKYEGRGLHGDDAYNAISNAASTSRPSVNADLGIDPNNPPPLPPVEQGSHGVRGPPESGNESGAQTADFATHPESVPEPETSHGEQPAPRSDPTTPGDRPDGESGTQPADGDRVGSARGIDPDLMEVDPPHSSPDVHSDETTTHHDGDGDGDVDMVDAPPTHYDGDMDIADAPPAHHAGDDVHLPSNPKRSDIVDAASQLNSQNTLDNSCAPIALHHEELTRTGHTTVPESIGADRAGVTGAELQSRAGDRDFIPTSTADIEAHLNALGDGTTGLVVVRHQDQDVGHVLNVSRRDGVNYIDDVPAGLHGRLSEHGLGDTVTMAHTGYRDPSGAPVRHDDIRLQDGTSPTSRTPFDTEQSLGAKPKRKADADDGPEPSRKSARLAAREAAREPDSRPGGDRSHDDGTAQNRPHDSNDQSRSEQSRDDGTPHDRDDDSSDTPDPGPEDSGYARAALARAEEDAAAQVESGNAEAVHATVEKLRESLPETDVEHTTSTDQSIKNPVRSEHFSFAESRTMSAEEFTRRMSEHSGKSRVGAESLRLDPNTHYVVKGAGSLYTRADGTVQGITYVPRPKVQNILGQHRWRDVSVITDRAFFHRDSTGALTSYEADAHVVGKDAQLRNNWAQKVTVRDVLTDQVLKDLNDMRAVHGDPPVSHADFNAGHPTRNELGAPSEPFVYSMEFADVNQWRNVAKGRDGVGFAVEQVLTNALQKAGVDARGIWQREEVISAHGGPVPEHYIVRMSLDGGRTVETLRFYNRTQHDTRRS